MDINGNFKLLGQGQLQNARIENVTVDPVSPSVGQIWFNVTDQVYRGFDGVKVTTFAVGSNTELLQTEIDQIETSIGLDANGNYVAPLGSNYLGTTTSVVDALTAVDGQLKITNDTAAALATTVGTLQTEVDTVEAGVGLNADGSYTAPENANYIAGATTLKAAAQALDAQVKTNTDAIAANTAAISTKVDRAGDSLTGNLAFGGTSTVTGLAAPVNSTDAARKIDLENALAGLDFQSDVLGTEADFTNVAGRYIYIDGSKFTGGTAAINDIVVVDAAGAVQSVAYDVSAMGEGALAWNRAATSWYRWNGTQWDTFGGLTDLNAGVGLVKDGNVINVNLGAGIAQLPTDEVGVDLYSAGGLWLTEDGLTASESGDAKIAIRVENTTLEVGATGLKVAASGITPTELHTSVAGAGLLGGMGSALSVGAGTGITVTDDAVAVDTAYMDANYARLDGADFTGTVTVQAPVANNDAARKIDVDTVNARINNSYFEYNGAVSGTSHVVAHNFGKKYPIVQVINSADQVIIPDSITFDSANQLTVSFLTAMTCRVVCTAPKV